MKPESLTRQKAFFDTFLRGEKTEVQYWPKVRYAVREAFYVGEWREAESFPIPNTQYTEYFPTPSKGLSLASQPAEHKSSYDSRSETLTFELPITKSFEFVGHSRLRLWVEAEGADNLDLFVTLRKVGKDGKPVYFPWLTIIDNGPIAFGFLRTSRRELDQSKSSPWQPYHTHARDLPPLKAGEVVPVDIEILPTSCRFRPGERLQVCIAGSDYGKYPTNIPVSRHPKNINKGRHVVHFGGKYNSGLLLPVLPPIENSWQEKNKTVKVFLSGTRPKSADVDVQAAVGIFGKKIEKIAETLPFLMATTTLITSPKGTLPALEANADSATATALGWSSFAGLQAIRHPAFATAVKPDLVPDNHKQIGSIAVAFSDVKFDPVGFVQRHDALVVLTYLPKAANFDPRQVAEDLGERAQSLAKAGAGTTLLRYVLNMDITPPNHAQMLGGTLFETVEWGAVAAVEQYWFADEAAAEAFFSDDGRAKVLKTLPTSMDGSKMFSIVGKESTQLEKDPDF